MVAHDIDAGRLVEVGAAWEPNGGDFYVLAPRTAKNYRSGVEVMSWLKARAALDI